MIDEGQTPPRQRTREIVPPLRRCLRFLSPIAAPGVAAVLRAWADGASGLHLRRAGWHTIAQDKAIALWHALPAVEIGAAAAVLPCEQIGDAIVQQMTRLSRARESPVTHAYQTHAQEALLPAARRPVAVLLQTHQIIIGKPSAASLATQKGIEFIFCQDGQACSPQAATSNPDGDPSGPCHARSWTASIWQRPSLPAGHRRNSPSSCPAPSAECHSCAPPFPPGPTTHIVKLPDPSGTARPHPISPR